MKNLVNLAQALFDTQRLQIIKLLQSKEMCVCELAAVFKISSPRMSQHLAVLRQAGIVKERRDGKWVYYSLNSKAVEAFTREWASFVQQPVESIAGMKRVLNRLQRLNLESVKRACPNK